MAGRSRVSIRSTPRLCTRCGGGRTGSVISPALFNHFVSDCPIPDLDKTSYTDDFTLLASTLLPASRKSRQGQTNYVLLLWGWQMASNWPFIAPQKSSGILFASDTHQSRLHPQVRIVDAVAPLRTPKIIGVTLDTYFPLAFTPAIVPSGLRGLSTSWKT